MLRLWFTLLCNFPGWKEVRCKWGTNFSSIMTSSYNVELSGSILTKLNDFSVYKTKTVCHWYRKYKQHVTLQSLVNLCFTLEKILRQGGNPAKMQIFEKSTLNVGTFKNIVGLMQINCQVLLKTLVKWWNNYNVVFKNRLTKLKCFFFTFH